MDGGRAGEQEFTSATSESKRELCHEESRLDRASPRTHVPPALSDIV
jgi:hypothetical protein